MQLQKELVFKKIQEVQKKLDTLGFPTIDIKFDICRLKAGYAGMAYRSVNYIEISKDYLREHQEKVLTITVPHEVCHLYVNKYFPRAKQYHGPEFKRLMNLLGLTGDTYHTMKLENGPKVNKRMKVRYVYKSSVTSVELLLTKGQHEQQMVSNCYLYRNERYQNEKIIYTGSTKRIK